MHLYDLLAHFALFLVYWCVFYQEFGFGSPPFRLGIWAGMAGEHAYWRLMVDMMTMGQVQLPNEGALVRKVHAGHAPGTFLGYFRSLRRQQLCSHSAHFGPRRRLVLGS